MTCQFELDIGHSKTGRCCRELTLGPWKTESSLLCKPKVDFVERNTQLGVTGLWIFQTERNVELYSTVDS